MSQFPTVPARDGPSSVRWRARLSRAERRKGGEEMYHRSTWSRALFHRAGKASGSRSDQARSSTTSRSTSRASPPPSTASTPVVTIAAAVRRRSPSLRLSRWTRGSSMALSPRASRKGRRGTSSQRKKM